LYIILKMLKHIEETDQIEPFYERRRIDVALYQMTRRTLAGVIQTFGKQVHTYDNASGTNPFKES